MVCRSARVSMQFTVFQKLRVHDGRDERTLAISERNLILGRRSSVESRFTSPRAIFFYDFEKFFECGDEVSSNDFRSGLSSPGSFVVMID